MTLPSHRDLYHGGAWHPPARGRYLERTSPGTGEALGRIADATAEDVDAAVASARAGFKIWSRLAARERGQRLRQLGATLRQHADELALIDAIDGGNPVRELLHDIQIAADQLELFAGLVTEIKGASVPLGPDAVHFSVREPLGVVARIIAFNHPIMFCVAKLAAPLAAGNSVIVKPPEQAPLSALRFVELVEGILPAGVVNVVPGGAQVGAALAGHPGVSKVALIGSVPTGRAVMRAAAETIKPVMLELGGKNALIAFPDADVDEVAAAAVAGMNFAWCGQSCGSTSRAFVHRAIYDAVLDRIPGLCRAFTPGLPGDMATTMGALISKPHHDRVLAYVAAGRAEGARLLCGGEPPADPRLAGGFYLAPTVFADATPAMRIAREEIFGPVLTVLPWSDEDEMIDAVNSVSYGLTCAIWTRDLSAAHRTAARVEVGYVWINDVSRHYLGTPFGGVKHSGIGREECLGELLDFTQEKTIHIRVSPAKR